MLTPQMVRLFISSEFITPNDLLLKKNNYGLYVSLKIKAHLPLKEILLHITIPPTTVWWKDPAPHHP